jgi:hypothetical protein
MIGWIYIPWHVLFDGRSADVVEDQETYPGGDLIFCLPRADMVTNRAKALNGDI